MTNTVDDVTVVRYILSIKCALNVFPMGLWKILRLCTVKRLLCPAARYYRPAALGWVPPRTIKIHSDVLNRLTHRSYEVSMTLDKL